MPSKRKILQTALIALIYLAIWEAVSLLVGKELLLPSPLSTLSRLAVLLTMGESWLYAGLTLLRIMSGYVIGVVAGVLLAVLTARSCFAEALLSPLRAIVKASPVTSFILLALLWLSSDLVPLFISFLMVLPVVYTNTLAGIRETDARLLEMAAVFRVPPAKRVRYLYVPAALPYFRSACTVGLGLCWKSGVAAEVIGITSGSIGEALYNAKILFSTAELLAWTVVIVLLSLAFERLFLWGLARVESVLLERSGT